jgi:hypothetical protein
VIELEECRDTIRKETIRRAELEEKLVASGEHLTKVMIAHTDVPDPEPDF